MNLICDHCGQSFVITADQLGTRGKCPHCRATIILPRAHVETPPSRLATAPTPWFELSFSTIGTILFHVFVVVLLMLVPWNHWRAGYGAASGSSIQLALSSSTALTSHDDSHLSIDQPTPLAQRARQSDVSLPRVAADFGETGPAPSLEFSSPDGDGPWGGGSGGAGARGLEWPGGDHHDFGLFVSQLKRDGLDIVIVFDSTGSMSGEIRQVKDKINRIGNTLQRLIPKTRLSIVTYRDTDDRYLVNGIPLTDSLGELITFLDGIEAGGGGDEPEAVEAGLAWAIQENEFRGQARKVILLFGDAPPHARTQASSLRLAAEFHRRVGGIVSTVTCRSDKPLAEFVAIAEMGGGEAFLARDERELMTQLIVLVFGSQHREKVIEAFDLLAR